MEWRARREAQQAEESLEELSALAASAGAVVVDKLLQHRPAPDPATLIGRGKLEELKGLVAGLDTDLVILDLDLTPTQLRNLERELECRVIDRTQLILDIFARHGGPERRKGGPANGWEWVIPPCRREPRRLHSRPPAGLRPGARPGASPRWRWRA